MTLHVGDQVKLTDVVARGMSQRSRGWHMDWSARHGVVVHCKRHSVLVVWEGRSSVDEWPVKALVKQKGQ